MTRYNEADLVTLVADIVEDARSSWGDRYDLSIDWELSGDAPAGQTVEGAVAAADACETNIRAAPNDDSTNARG